MEYTIKRTRRKTFAVQVMPTTIFIKAPKEASDEEIASVVKKHEKEIEKIIEKRRVKMEEYGDLTPFTKEEIENAAQKAAKIIPEKMSYYAEKMGLNYNNITIRNQKSKWGSCRPARKNFNFNCLLMFLPDEVVDSVVVHELCHLLQPNHSPAFYRECKKVLPNYDELDKWLTKNELCVMQRMCLCEEKINIHIKCDVKL